MLGCRRRSHEPGLSTYIGNRLSALPFSFAAPEADARGETERNRNRDAGRRTPTMIVPAWINPKFRLIEDGVAHDWASVAALAERLAPELPPGGRVAVSGQSAVTLIAALVAAQWAGTELILLRRAAPRPAGASLQIEKGGRVLRLGPNVITARTFALLIPTSGTTGEPKLVCHDFIRLMGRVRGGHGSTARWLLAYEGTAFGGLQVLLTVVSGGATLVMPPQAQMPGPDIDALTRLAVEHQVTHVSATPCVWHQLLPRLIAVRPPLRVATLGGDISDQPLLDRLVAAFPGIRVRQIYASTEAGVVFTVTDGKAGFPAIWLETGVDDAQLRIRAGALQVQCPRHMTGHAGGEARPLTTDGWLITGDLVERQGNRVFFTGREEVRAIVEGGRVSPPKVEIALLDVSGVREAWVYATQDEHGRPLLEAAIQLEPGADSNAVRARLIERVAALHHHDRPDHYLFVESIQLAPSGKKARTALF